MGKQKVLIILIGIVLLAAALRLWNLGHVPISPDWDEVSLGYNAYSILHTGHDEYNTFLPVVLKSFGDYKPALYAYTIIPFLLIFNLSVAAVRFPSALSGIGSVIAIYFLIKEIYKKDSLALAAAFFMAISPWSIQFSRVGFESNLGLFLNLLTVLFFIKGMKKPWMLSVSALSAALSLYAYQSEKIFTPLLVLILLWFYRSQFFAIPKKYLVAFVIVGLIAVMPLLSYTILNPYSLSRATSTSIFSGTNDALLKSGNRMLYDRQHHDLIGMALDNRQVVYIKEITASYLSHFDFNWLFITGDIARHHAPEMGMLYLFEIPLLLIGCFQLLLVSFQKRTYEKWIPFIFLVLGPLPAAFTHDTPHAVRALNMLPFFTIASGYGAIFIWERLLRWKYYLIVIVISALMFAFNFAYYIDQYFVQQNYFNASEWQYGYEKVVNAIAKTQNNYSKIIVSNEMPMDQSYVFFLFYFKYPPEKYQTITANYISSTKTFDKFEFRQINWANDKNIHHVLFIGTAKDFPSEVHPQQTIRYPDGTEAMRIVRN